MNKWQRIYKVENDVFYDETERMKIHGGWLVRTILLSKVNSIFSNQHQTTTSLTFVPDAEHKWKK